MKYKVVLIVVLLCFSNGCDFRKNHHSGYGFSVTFPQGWKRGENHDKLLFRISAEKPRIITYYSPKRASEDGIPNANISVYAQKFSDPIWIEDVFPQILGLLKGQGYRVLDEGQIKINGIVSHWVLYQVRETGTTQIAFYVISDSKVFIKLKYMANDSSFKTYREEFEAARKTFKFKLGIM